MSRYLLLLLPLLVLGECAPAPPPTGQQRADASTLAACREHADEVYNRTNRDSIYTITTTKDAPFSGNYLAGVVDRGLPARYGRENMVRDCVRNTGTETDRTATTSPAPAPGLTR